MRSLLLAVLVGAGLACDPCSAVARIHMVDCNSGDQNACSWLQAHGVTPAGTCQVE